jgi:hypothetical protein
MESGREHSVMASGLLNGIEGIETGGVELGDIGIDRAGASLAGHGGQSSSLKKCKWKS